jgi:hypothetical protein
VTHLHGFLSEPDEDDGVIFTGTEGDDSFIFQKSSFNAFAYRLLTGWLVQSGYQPYTGDLVELGRTLSELYVKEKLYGPTKKSRFGVL